MREKSYNSTQQGEEDLKLPNKPLLICHRWVQAKIPLHL